MSMFAQFSYAQTIETEEEYIAIYDRLVSRFREAEKEKDSMVGKSFSEFVSFLDKHDLKIKRVMWQYEDDPRYLTTVHGLYLWFTTREEQGFSSSRGMTQPTISLFFKEGLPYDRALELLRKYDSYFEEEVEAFYADAIIEHIVEFFIPEDVYNMHLRNLMIERGTFPKQKETLK